MIWPVLTALLSHWRRYPLQLFTLTVGLALATALWSGVQAINAEARASYDIAASTLGEGQFDRLVPRDGQPFDQTVFVDLRRAGWRVSPVVQGDLNGIRLIGIEPLTAPGALLPINAANSADLTAFLAGNGLIRAAPDAVAALSGLGQVIADDAIAPGTAITDIGVAQGLLGKAGLVDLLIVDPVQPMHQPSVSEFAPELSIQAARSGAEVGRLTDSFHLNLTAFGLLSFVVGLFIVHGAIALAFEQRRAMVRTLRALGVPLRLLVGVMVLELLGLALVSGAIGTAMGYLIASLLLPDVAATLRGLYGADVANGLQFRPVWWVSGMAIAVCGTMIAAAGALWRIGKMPILSGAQPRALALTGRRNGQVQGWVALALLAVGCVLAATAAGLVSGFVMLAALLLGAALALPVLLAWVLGLLQASSRDVVAQWFWADARQQLPALSLALMALMLAMAANVGVSTMVSSFRLTFVGFLDQRLASELYIAVDDQQQADQLFGVVSGHVDAVLPIQSAREAIAGVPTEIYGNRDHATYRDNWLLLQSGPAPWDAVAGGSGVLINEQLARRSNIWVGDQILVAGEAFEIQGVYGDYGNPLGQAVIDEHRFAALFPDELPRRFGLRLDPEKVGPLRERIGQATSIPQANMINQAGIKAASLAVFDRTFTVTSALNVLTLTVAGFAILMSLLTLSAMRVPQLAPAWAMGLTRAQLGRLELLRTCFLAVLTGVFALPLGLALAWALLAIVNVAAFGWRLPMFLFPVDYAVLGGLALLAAFLAALWPAVRLARTPPSALLQVFSNER